MANKFLTIYVGSDMIRVAEIVKNGKAQIVLTNAAEITTPAGAYNDGYLLDVTAVAEAVRTAIFGRGFNSKDVVFTIASKKIASKEVELPYVKNTKKLQQVLQALQQEHRPELQRVQQELQRAQQQVLQALQQEPQPEFQRAQWELQQVP